MECFKNWDDSIHAEYDQVKRRLSGEKINPDVIVFNAEHQIAFIQGSGSEPYKVTLKNCTCMDFFRREEPCKHMYRLADELGLLDPWPALNKKGAEQAWEMCDEDIEKWQAEFIAGNISAKKFVRICDALSSK